MRGGDIDEVRIYDRMLSDDGVAALAGGLTPADAFRRSASSLDTPGMAAGVVVPLRLEPARRRAACRSDTPAVRVRKVEIHDVYDLKRWTWKGTDGIRETTWPGVYNRSRLPGRNDYFQLPDWDCYSLSGKSVTFVMPDEPWNQIEISGAAWGSAALVAARRSDGPEPAGTALFERPRGQERTFHRLPRRSAASTFASPTPSRRRPSASSAPTT